MARHLTTGSDDGDNLLQADDRGDLLYAFAAFDNINNGRGNDLIYAGGLDGVHSLGLSDFLLH